MEFNKFNKISRLSKPVVITEKIDGTNAQVCISEEGIVYAGSRSKWLWDSKDGFYPGGDNYGFGGWVKENIEDLKNLGVGSHFGEWWGMGIQRKYGLKEKRFSLFNVHKWGENRPAWANHETFDSVMILKVLQDLRQGSIASPGFMNPEGIVIFHSASGTLFKKTFDDGRKGS